MLFGEVAGKTNKNKSKNKMFRKYWATALLALASFCCIGQNTTSITGCWQGSLDNKNGGIEIFFTIEQSDNLLSATMTVPEQGVKGMPIDSVSFDGFNLYLGIKTIQMEYKGFMVMNSFTGNFIQYGVSFPMALTRGEIPVAKRPQEPSKPYPYREEEVVFHNNKAGINLSGTLTIPSGNAPFPALILISGSGYQDRNEELMGHKPFLVIADALTRSGIAVLRYDDRGVGSSEGSTSGNTTEDLSWDAQAALQYLEARSEISSIGLAGHSEGGAIAFIVAARDSSCDFVISLAGPGLRGDKVLLAQQKAILSRSGMASAQLEQVEAANRMLFDIIISSQSNDNQLRERIIQMTGGQEEVANQLLDPWMYHFIKYDPAADISKIKVPILALNGSKDLQVIAQPNLESILKYSKEGGNNNVSTIQLEGLNHLFQYCDTGLPTEYSKIEETISPEVLDEMVRFISTFAAANETEEQ